MTITETTMELLSLRTDLIQIESVHAEKIAPLKQKLEELKKDLVEKLNEQGLRSIKTADANFAITSKEGFRFLNEAKALTWGKKNNVVKLDSRMAAQKLKEMKKLPDFVETIAKDYLTIKETTKK